MGKNSVFQPQNSHLCLLPRPKNKRQVGLPEVQLPFFIAASLQLQRERERECDLIVATISPDSRLPQCPAKIKASRKEVAALFLPHPSPLLANLMLAAVPLSHSLSTFSGFLMFIPISATV